MIHDANDVVSVNDCRANEHAARRLAARGAFEQALEKCDKAVRSCPESVETLRLRGRLLLKLGRAAEATKELDRVVELRPSCVECRFERGYARISTGDVDAALADFQACLDRDPDFAPALASRALILSREKRYPEALRDISRAIELRPGNDADLHNRAVVLAALGRHRESIREYEQVLRINPRSGGSHNNLAWLLSTSPDPSLRDGPRAVDHARKALEIGAIGAWMDTLAAALAESGDFEQAVEVEKQAYARSQPKNEAFRRRIEVYRRGLSYAAWRERNTRQNSKKGR